MIERFYKARLAGDEDEMRECIRIAFKVAGCLTEMAPVLGLLGDDALRAIITGLGMDLAGMRKLHLRGRVRLRRRKASKG